MSPPSWAPFPTLAPSHPSRSSQSTELSSLCCAAAPHWLSMSHPLVYMCQCCSPSFSHPPSPNTVSTTPFSASASLLLPCKHQSQWPSSENLQPLNAAESVEKWKSSCTVSGNANWYSHYGEQYGGSLLPRLLSCFSRIRFCATP